jgi:hypothetical protein
VKDSNSTHGSDITVLSHKTIDNTGARNSQWAAKRDLTAKSQQAGNGTIIGSNGTQVQEIDLEDAGTCIHGHRYFCMFCSTIN